MVRKKIGDVDVDVLTATITLANGTEFRGLEVTTWDTRAHGAKGFPPWAGYFDAPKDVAADIMLGAEGTCEIAFEDGRSGTVRVILLQPTDSGGRVNILPVGPMRGAVQE